MTDKAEEDAAPPALLRVCSTHSLASYDACFDADDLNRLASSPLPTSPLATSPSSRIAWDETIMFNRSTSFTSQTSLQTVSSDVPEGTCRLCLVRVSTPPLRCRPCVIRVRTGCAKVHHPGTTSA